jgi:hypothetical protein
MWRPPLGIFEWDKGLGAGKFNISLRPSGNYLLTGVETRNPSYTTSVDGTTGTYSLVITDIKFYAYVEKIRIPDQVQELNLMEYQVDSQPWSNTLQFRVSPYTQALSIFVQDIRAGSSPLYPPSMFKVSDNSDLMLTQLQVSYAGMTKPSTPFISSYFAGSNQLQQRYHDTYEQSSAVLKEFGCETYSDWLQRGPIYHFDFTRDPSNKSTDVSINTTFNGLVDGPGSGTGGTGSARVFCVSHFAKRVSITTAAGEIVNITAQQL